MIRLLTAVILLQTAVSINVTGASRALVDAGALVPGAEIDIRYAGSDNFMGTGAGGYQAREMPVDR